MLFRSAYKSKRKRFFKKELFNAFQILDNKSISQNKLFGSWAGAMGQSQFMPSSYLNYAYDYDKDNNIDLWSNYSDIFASISNYLKKHGWKKKQPWSIELNKANISKHDLKNKYSLKELGSNKNYFKNKFYDLKGNIIKISDKNTNKFYLVYDNFYILKKYNNSNFYALTVGDLALKILELQ